ncbi:hypothetical protein TNCV_3022701 [Trichonephila clavipes]|nr:hypothetical protein TNCV_3022701 [Trichonephila clavipes]
MTIWNHMCCHSFNGSHEPFSNNAMLILTQQECYYPSLACPILRFVSNRAYLGSFGQRVGHFTSLNELETRDKVARKMAQTFQEIIQTLYASMTDRALTLEGVQQDIISSVLLPFSLK